MSKFTKALTATVAAAAVTLATATPATARDRDGIDAGDIIAGALILGGIAAVAGAFDRDDGYTDGYRYDDYDDRRYDDRYDRRGRYYDRGRGSPQAAIEQCVRTAERTASRYSYGGRADVTDIRDIRENRSGYTVKGRIAVNANGRGWRNGDRDYGRGWGGDYRGWDNSHRGYDSGSFKCRVEYGRIVDLDFSGIRGL